MKTLTIEQMNVVIARAKFCALMDIIQAEKDAGLPARNHPGFMELYRQIYSNDKMIHAMEDAIYTMRQEAEAVSGTYDEYKKSFAGNEITTRYAITNGSEFFKTSYDANSGNWGSEKEATTYASEKIAATKLEERRSYFCITGRHNDAAKLKVVPVEK